MTSELPWQRNDAIAFFACFVFLGTMRTGREKCFATVVLIPKGVVRTQMWYSRKWSNWPPSPSSKRLLSRKRPLYDVQFVLDSLFNRRPRLIDAPPPPVTFLKNTRN